MSNKDIKLLKSEFEKLNISSKNNKSQLNRNYGIDLLKIFSMINIINLHININLLYLIPSNPKFKTVYRFETFSIFAVDAFGIISGIVGYKRYKLVNLIYLYFEYYFYSVIMQIYYYYKSIESLKILIHHFFPLGIKRNWFPNAYILMYLFLPFLTNSINTMDRKLFSKIVIFLIFIYSLYHTVVKFLIGNTQYDFVINGYSSLWLLILYIIGAYIGRFEKNKKIRFYPLFFLIYLLDSFLSSELFFYIVKKYKLPYKFFLDYCFPNIMIQALSLIFFFSNLKISNKYLIKIILFLNPLNFNICLIHSKILFTKTPMILKFNKYIKSMTPKFLFFKLYVISIMVYVICAFIDYFRFLLFKIFRIRNLSIYIEKKIL